MTSQQPRLSNSGGRWPDPQTRMMGRVKLDENGCWRWQGPKIPSRGSDEKVYGYSFQLNGKPELAHRAAYKLWVGEIPEGFTIDHLCGVKDCCNPSHLEAVTARENLQRSANTWVGQNSRKTHCPSGHEYTPENTRVGKRSMGRAGFNRFCKECARIHGREQVRVGVHCTSCDFRGRRAPGKETNPCPRCGNTLALNAPRKDAA